MQRASLTTDGDLTNQPCPGDGLVNSTIHSPVGFLINVRFWRHYRTLTRNGHACYEATLAVLGGLENEHHVYSVIIVSNGF